MHRVPEDYEFIEVARRKAKHPAHGACRCASDCIAAVCDRDNAVRELHNYFASTDDCMDVSWLVVLRICDEPHPAENPRCHYNNRSDAWVSRPSTILLAT